MGLFGKKKVEQVPTPPPKPTSTCDHKFQDFPWYIEGECDMDCYYNRYYVIKIKEPYVCVYCGKREDKELFSIKHYGSEADGEKAMADLKKKFSNHIRHRAEIEDMINDFKLVDVEHLKYYHLLAGTTDPSTSRPQPTWDNKPELKL